MHAVEHQNHSHVVCGAAKIERLSEPWPVVGPAVESKLRVGVISQIVCGEAAVVAASIPVGVGLRRRRGNPGLAAVGGGLPAKMQRHIFNVIHVVGKEKNCISATAEQTGVARNALELKVDVMWIHYGAG